MLFAGFATAFERLSRISRLLASAVASSEQSYERCSSRMTDAFTESLDKSAITRSLDKSDTTRSLDKSADPSLC